MRIRKKFLKLTRFTYPHGTETLLDDHLPEGYKVDKFGNYYLSVGDNYTTMFACHLDTACKSMNIVNHTFTDRYIGTDGTTILGADDKAGMVVSLYMIENKIPGLYYFFLGEEVGCIGSSALSKELDKADGEYPKELKNITKVVSFDRRGTTSVITSQLYGDCCSDEFAKALSIQLNTAGFGLEMVPDATGIMTDSAQFMTNVPECTNISVGYYNEHTPKEIQDIDFLYKLCKSVVKVDWESLPVLRTPGMNFWNDWDDYERPVRVTPNGDYSEDNYTYIKDETSVTGRKKAYISKTWINHETLLIHEMFRKHGKEVDDVSWDGTSLWVQYTGTEHNEYVGGRKDLSSFIEKIMTIPNAHLRYEL